MPKTYMKEVTGTQLVTGVLGTIDFGNIIANAIELTKDLQMAEEEYKKLKTVTEYLTKSTPLDVKKFALSDIETIISKASDNLYAFLSGINEQIKSQVGASAGGFRATASLIGQKIKLMSQAYPIDFWTELAIGIPMQKAEDKAERYYNKILAPYLPSERDAFMLYRLGKWSKTAFVNALRETQGINSLDAENITEMREWQIGKPSLRDAWYFVQKGYKPKEYFYDLAQKGFGWTKEDADALYKHYTYDFSPSELLRLSDLIPLESSWIEKKLIANGLEAEDRAIFKTAIEKRTIRDEINKAWSLLLDCYQWGLFTKTAVESLLTSWKFSAQEISIKIETAELLKLKLRVKLLRDAEIYLYRNGIITKETLLTRLVNLGIGKDIANAIVRNEAAKKGEEWEIPSE